MKTCKYPGNTTLGPSMTHRPLHQDIYHQGASYEVLKETFLKIGVFWDMIFLVAFTTTDKSYNPQKI
jgi:hypothetical protein